jgi:hypothetical protein
MIRETVAPSHSKNDMDAAKCALVALHMLTVRAACAADRR